MGGSLGFTLPFLLFIFSSLFFFRNLENGSVTGLAFQEKQITWVFALGALVFFIIGFLDDCYSLSASLRFSLSFFFCAFLCFWSRGEGEWKGEWEEGALVLVQTLWLLSCINFFKFMDGMDGIAGLQALWISLMVSLGTAFAFETGGFLTLNLALYKFVFWSYLALACLLTAFLYWNWPRAKLFMGDGGSYFLGFVLGFSALWAQELNFLGFALRGQEKRGLWFFLLNAAPICMAWMPFLLDTSLSLLERLRSSGNIFQAHREHLYQRLLAKQYSPQKVLLFYMSLNATFAFPIVLFFVLDSPWLALFLGSCLTLGNALLFLRLKHS